MKVRAQDIKPGNMLRTAIGSIVKAKQVHIFEEKKTPFVMPGRAAAYLPGCILLIYETKEGVEQSYTFQIDEEVERIFSAE